MPAEMKPKRRGPKRDPKCFQLAKQVKALKPTHSYTQIAKLLGITRGMAHYYGRVATAKREVCRCCLQPLPK